MRSVRAGSHVRAFDLECDQCHIPCDGEPFATALKEIVRLEPSAFTLLPRQISDWMQQEGYTVPQSYCDSAPHNVASGNLNEDSILDWAVLCSRADTSRVAIF